MKEYIEKEAFKQYLLELKKQVNEIMPGQNVISGTTLSELIDRFPAAADVVEVVRCRECVYREMEEPGMVYCPSMVGGWVDENWFCAGGEKE